jgi:hypothetical protein
MQQGAGLRQETSSMLAVYTYTSIDMSMHARQWATA